VTVPAEPTPPDAAIAGRLLPIAAAEELLATLTGVVSVRIAVTSDGSTIDAVHVLTTDQVSPKATVRNVESALMAHFGLRVDHRKVSVATTQDGARAAVAPASGLRKGPVGLAEVPPSGPVVPVRRLYFEDVEVRRSRTRGVTCRVTLRKGNASFVGDAEGMEHDRAWIELAAQATMAAIAQAEGDLSLGLYGVKLLEAFDRQFVFVGVTARIGRESMLLTGSCEVKESAETSSALAVLDATNRYLAQVK
jgi:hypothetical protein